MGDGYAKCAAVQQYLPPPSSACTCRQLTRDSFTEVLEKALHPDTPPEQRKAQLRRLNALFSIFVKDKCDEKVEIDELSSGLRTLFAGTDDEKLEFAFQGVHCCCMW